MTTIDGKLIGPGQPCFIVAELSGNHHQKFEEAVVLIHAAAEAGVDAVKLQTYTPDTITIKSNKSWFMVGGKDQPALWQKKILWDLYESAYTPWEWQPELKKIAEDLGLILFSTPFDETAVDFLEEMGVPCYKVASYEAIHIPLLKKIAKTGKPVIVSIGFASTEEVELALQTLRNNGAQDIVLLHCVTSYANKPQLEYMNLKTITDIKERFGVLSGFSDNNAGIEVPIIAATIAGALVIEKHLTRNRLEGGPDARFSLEPQEFKKMVTLIRRIGKEGSVALQGIVSRQDIEKAMGQVQYGPASAQEKENMFFRPSLWVKKNIAAGELFTPDNIRVARPSSGLPPGLFDVVLGRTAALDIESVTPLTWDLIQK